MIIILSSYMICWPYRYYKTEYFLSFYNLLKSSTGLICPHLVGRGILSALILSMSYFQFLLYFYIMSVIGEILLFIQWIHVLCPSYCPNFNDIWQFWSSFITEILVCIRICLRSLVYNTPNFNVTYFLHSDLFLLNQTLHHKYQMHIPYCNWL